MLEELTAIENELDNILPQYEDDLEVREALSYSQGTAGGTQGPLREQVFLNAKKIDKEVDDLNGQLAGVQ